MVQCPYPAIGEPKAKPERRYDRCPEHLATGEPKVKTELSVYGTMSILTRIKVKKQKIYCVLIRVNGERVPAAAGRGGKMIKSMTGFGRSEMSDGKRNVVVEIRAVNHRYSDITVKMPRRYSFAEEKLKALVKGVARRGKIDVSINVENITEDDTTVRLNTMVARQYYDNMKELANTFGLPEEISLQYLASLPDVMKAVPDLEDEEAIYQSLAAPVAAAAEKLNEMRVTEGKKLAEDIIMRGRLIHDMVDKVEKRSPQVTVSYTEKLRNRIRELIGDTVAVPEDRILVEAAIFADKCSVTEELVRLDSHISQLESIITKSNQPDGKKLDFLVQEMNREANTIGSKANDIEITNLVLDMKSEIEKIREQVQNIE